MSPTTDRLLSSREAAELLNLREATLVAWRTRQTPNRPRPGVVGSRSIRYREADLLKWRDRETKVRSWSTDRQASTRRSK
jgi:predicted DNA-binding transcriptional regulator AlpA